VSLLAVVLILIVWAVIDIINAAKPTNPPIKDIKNHCKTIQQLPNKKARRKYLNNLSKIH